MIEQKLFFDDSDRLFVGNSYSLTNFNFLYENIIFEHVKDLYTPKDLLEYIKNKLRYEESLVYLSGDKLLNFLNKEEKEKFIKFYGKKYQLYILYCNPIIDMNKFNWKYKNQITNYFKSNKLKPAARFYNNKLSIIILNSKIIDIDNNENEIELQLDHELNHIFEKLYKKEIEDINKEAQKEIIDWFHTNNIISLEELISDDFSIHMFNSSEFIEMTANLCNVLSLILIERDKIKLIKKMNEMISEEYLKSDEFKKLNEPIRGSIIFAFICKKFSPKRWNRVLKAIYEQLNLNNVQGKLKIFFLNIFQNITNFLKGKR